MVGRRGCYRFTLCSSCKRYRASTETAEMKVLNVLRHFFPGIQYSKYNYFAGKFCPAAGGCGGAYPDLYIFTGDMVVFIEIDEDCHAQYNSSQLVRNLPRGYRNPAFHGFNVPGHCFGYMARKAPPKVATASLGRELLGGGFKGAFRVDVAWPRAQVPGGFCCVSDPWFWVPPK